MSAYIDGFKVFFSAGGTKIDIASSGINLYKGEYFKLSHVSQPVAHTSIALRSRLPVGYAG